MLFKDWIVKVCSGLTLVKFVRIFFLLFMVTATIVNIFYSDIIMMDLVKAFTIAQIIGLILLSYVMGWTDGSGEQ